MTDWNSFNSISCLGVTNGSNPSQLFDDVAFAKVTVFNEVTFTRGTISQSLVTSNITLTASDDYKISASVNVELPSNDELVMAFFIDNVQVGTQVHIQGSGPGKPVYLSGFNVASLVAGQVIDVRALNSGVGSTTATFTAATLLVEHV